MRFRPKRFSFKIPTSRKCLRAVRGAIKFDGIEVNIFGIDRKSDGAAKRRNYMTRAKNRKTKGFIRKRNE